MAEKDRRHPYLPSDLQIPNYVPNTSSVNEILLFFFLPVSIAFFGTWLFSGRKEHLKGKYLTRAKICWFVMCIFVHGVVEGYFSVFHKSFHSQQSFLAQLWKEYSKADSRYMIGDPFTVCMETITAFIDGPLAVLAAYAFLYNTSSRHIIQILLSLCQLYGDVLYFSTEIVEGFIHGPMYHPFYFWFYFITANAVWIIVPLLCIVESSIALTKAQSAADSYKVRGKKNT